MNKSSRVRAGILRAFVAVLGVSAMTMAGPTQASAYNGHIHWQNYKSSKCLSANPDPAKGRVELRNCDNNDRNQMWDLDYVRTEGQEQIFRMVNVGQNKCLYDDYPARKGGSGAPLDPATAVKGLTPGLGNCLREHVWPTQEWRLQHYMRPGVAIANDVFVSTWSGLCLDGDYWTRTDYSQKVQTWTCATHPNLSGPEQQWMRQGG